MISIKIETFVNTHKITKEEAERLSLERVDELSEKNKRLFKDKAVVTKLYYLVPWLGEVFVSVCEQDRECLGVQSRVLFNTTTNNVSLAKLPAQIIDYQELIIRLGSGLTDKEILTIAVRLADKALPKVAPTRFPVVKIIDYNNVDESRLVVGSIFKHFGFLTTSDSFLGQPVDLSNGEWVVDGSPIEALELPAEWTEEYLVSINAGLPGMIAKAYLSLDAKDEQIEVLFGRNRVETGFIAKFYSPLENKNEQIEVLFGKNRATDNFQKIIYLSLAA